MPNLNNQQSPINVQNSNSLVLFGANDFQAVESQAAVESASVANLLGKATNVLQQYKQIEAKREAKTKRENEVRAANEARRDYRISAGTYTTNVYNSPNEKAHEGDFVSRNFSQIAKIKETVRSRYGKDEDTLKLIDSVLADEESQNQLELVRFHYQARADKSREEEGRFIKGAFFDAENRPDSMLNIWDLEEELHANKPKVLKAMRQSIARGALQGYLNINNPEAVEKLLFGDEESDEANFIRESLEQTDVRYYSKQAAVARKFQLEEAKNSITSTIETNLAIIENNLGSPTPIDEKTYKKVMGKGSARSWEIYQDKLKAADIKGVFNEQVKQATSPEDLQELIDVQKQSISLSPNPKSIFFKAVQKNESKLKAIMEKAKSDPRSLVDGNDKLKALVRENPYSAESIVRSDTLQKRFTTNPKILTEIQKKGILNKFLTAESPEQAFESITDLHQYGSNTARVGRELLAHKDSSGRGIDLGMALLLHPNETVLMDKALNVVKNYKSVEAEIRSGSSEKFNTLIADLGGGSLKGLFKKVATIVVNKDNSLGQIANDIGSFLEITDPNDEAKLQQIIEVYKDKSEESLTRITQYLTRISLVEFRDRGGEFKDILKENMTSFFLDRSYVTGDLNGGSSVIIPRQGTASNGSAYEILNPEKVEAGLENAKVDNKILNYVLDQQEGEINLGFNIDDIKPDQYEWSNVSGGLGLNLIAEDGTKYPLLAPDGHPLHINFENLEDVLDTLNSTGLDEEVSPDAHIGGSSSGITDNLEITVKKKSLPDTAINRDIRQKEQQDYYSEVIKNNSLNSANKALAGDQVKVPLGKNNLVAEGHTYLPVDKESIPKSSPYSSDKGMFVTPFANDIDSGFLRGQLFYNYEEAKAVKISYPRLISSPQVNNKVKAFKIMDNVLNTPENFALATAVKESGSNLEEKHVPSIYLNDVGEGKVRSLELTNKEISFWFKNNFFSKSGKTTRNAWIRERIKNKYVPGSSNKDGTKFKYEDARGKIMEVSLSSSQIKEYKDRNLADNQVEREEFFSKIANDIPSKYKFNGATESSWGLFQIQLAKFREFGYTDPAIFNDPKVQMDVFSRDFEKTRNRHAKMGLPEDLSLVLFTIGWNGGHGTTERAIRSSSWGKDSLERRLRFDFDRKAKIELVNHILDTFSKATKHRPSNDSPRVTMKKMFGDNWQNTLFPEKPGDSSKLNAGLAEIRKKGKV